ncbi:MAG: hypothetical protein F4X40_03395 [Chloroflexi bacterium]|nr:hypothetical protein [Chloroflexota bacterium]
MVELLKPWHRLCWISPIRTNKRALSLSFAGPAEGAIVITQTSGAQFATDGHMEMTCVVQGRASATGMSMEAPCTASASMHDALYLVSKRSGSTGRTELVGGTGMYRGIVGACDYEVSSVSPEVVVGTATCAWQR